MTKKDYVLITTAIAQAITAHKLETGGMRGRCAGEDEIEVQIRTYDVWGNARDGFEVNEVFRYGTFQVTPSQLDTKEGIVDFLNTNFFSKKVSAKQLDIDLSDETKTYVNLAKNGKPLLEIITE